MISKCPDCGRSYPTHHGKICKACAGKIQSQPAMAITSNVAVANPVQPPQAAKPAPSTGYGNYDYASYSVNTPSTPEPVKAATTEPARSTVPAASANPPGSTTINQPTGITPSPSSMNKPDEDRVNVLDDCPDCLTPNANSDLFCTHCGKMLVISQNKKMRDYPLTNLKGTFPDQLAKLKKLGITNTIQLLDKGYTGKKRKLISIKSGISETFLFRLVNQADLVRIEDLEPSDAFLLEIIGINTVKALEKKAPSDILNLITKNKSALFAKQVIIFPDINKIKKWSANAVSIEKLVTQ